MFWNNWHDVYSPSIPYVPPKLERMALGKSSFEFMRRVDIEYSGCSYAIGRPHAYQLSRIQTRSLVKLAESVRFIAEHCPLLLSFHIALRRYSMLEVPFKKFRTVIETLKHLVEQCRSLETLGIMADARNIYVNSTGRIHAPEFMLRKDVYDLDISRIPHHHRGDAVEQWSRSDVVQEAITYMEMIKFVPCPVAYSWLEFDQIVESIMQEVWQRADSIEV